ncbi:tolloid-like protein 2 [Trichonephila clavipes]|nr:tolloid-like protein 2 [Trichonephila clavipes]
MQNPSGTLSSPDYSNSVVPQEGIHCEWRITATQGERIILNITEIDIHKSENCDTDYLEVRDGYWYKSPLLDVPRNQPTSKSKQLFETHKNTHLPSDHSLRSMSPRKDTTKPLTVTSADVPQPNNEHDVLADSGCS